MMSFIYRCGHYHGYVYLVYQVPGLTLGCVEIERHSHVVYMSHKICH